MARTISDHRPDWVPGRSPSLDPALEMSVQGKPPHRRSMGLIPQRTRDQLMRRTSPRLGMPGQCLARTAFAAWSVSQCQTTVPPVACSTARSSMPLPENMDPIRMLHFATLRRRPHRSHLASESRGSWVRLYRTKQVKNRCINADGVQQAYGVEYHTNHYLTLSQLCQYLRHLACREYLDGVCPMSSFVLCPTEKTGQE